MAQLIKTWTFPSSSNPAKTYETSQYADGSTSCQCRGWTFAKHGVRSCTHTRKVEQGLADRESLSVWEAPTSIQNTRAFAEVLKSPSHNVVDKQAEELENARQWSMTESNIKKLARIKKQLEKPKKAVPVPKRLVNWR